MKGSVWDLPAYTTAMALHNDILDYATTCTLTAYTGKNLYFPALGLIFIVYLVSIWEEVKAKALVPDLRAYSAVMEAACALRDDVRAEESRWFLWLNLSS
jgi:hypothetical protein